MMRKFSQKSSKVNFGRILVQTIDLLKSSSGYIQIMRSVDLVSVVRCAKSVETYVWCDMSVRFHFIIYNYLYFFYVWYIHLWMLVLKVQIFFIYRCLFFMSISSSIVSLLLLFDFTSILVLFERICINTTRKNNFPTKSPRKLINIYILF